jgi:dolichol-phosphate mannosyltransferase
VIRVFLPAYNEEAALETLVRKFDAELKKIGERYDITVLDDGSSDRTAAVAQALAATYPVTLIKHPRNLGLGETMRDGLEAVARKSSPQDLVVTMDCDDTHEPRYMASAFEKVREGYDVVILSRYQEGGGEKGLSAVKSVLSRGAGLFLKLFFPIRGVKEYSCGYRVMKASAIQKALTVFGKDFVRFAHMGFVVTPEILIKFRMLGLRIGEVPFVLRYDQKPGASKNRPLKTIAGYFALVAHFWGRKAPKPS